MPQSADTLKISDITKNNPGNAAFTGGYTFEDLDTLGEITCDWKVKPETAGLSVKGNIRGVLSMECARCLMTYPLPVDLQIHERYVLDYYTDPYEREKELQPEDFFEVVNEEGVLDLKDLVHQFLILEAANHTTCGRSDCEWANTSQAS